MTTPDTMTAAVYDRFGGAEQVQLAEVPTPSPRRGEVLIRVDASTVSAADYRARSRDVPKGLAPLAALGIGIRRPRRRVLGMDAAGTVESVGAGVTQFAPGERVVAFLGGKFGGHAEYVRMPAAGPIAHAPSGMPLERAVAIVFGGLTAWCFLQQATIAPGMSVLVNGGSGAVGSAAIQLAKHRGARVTAVTSGKNADLVTDLGADEVIDYSRDDFTELGDTWDVVVDGVGNAPFERVEHVINPQGALLLVVVDLQGILRRGAQSRRSGKLVSWNVGKPSGADLAHLVALTEQGAFRPVVDRSYNRLIAIESAGGV